MPSRDRHPLPLRNRDIPSSLPTFIAYPGTKGPTHSIRTASGIMIDSASSPIPTPFSVLSFQATPTHSDRNSKTDDEEGRTMMGSIIAHDSMTSTAFIEALPKETAMGHAEGDKGGERGIAVGIGIGAGVGVGVVVGVLVGWWWVWWTKRRKEQVKEKRSVLRGAGGS